MRDETHCEHGTYVGYPGGPDYMCGYCEDGISVAELRKAQDECEAHELDRMWELTVVDSAFTADTDQARKATAVVRAYVQGVPFLND